MITLLVSRMRLEMERVHEMERVVSAVLSLAKFKFDPNFLPTCQVIELLCVKTFF